MKNVNGSSTTGTSMRRRGLTTRIQENKVLILTLIAIATSGTVFLLLNSLRNPDFVWGHQPRSSREDRPPAPDTTKWSNFSNIYVPPGSDYTSTLHRLLQLNGTDLCHNATTNFTRLSGLPKSNGKFVLQTNTKYELLLESFSADGKRRCSGGDYYEVDFHSDNYRSRLPTMDFHNGTYVLELTVPARWAGIFTIEIWLLFGNWHGMDPDAAKSVAVKTVVNSVEVELRAPKSQALDVAFQRNMTRCTMEDFERPHWSGRWSRGWFDDKCVADKEKRFRCLPPEHSYCEEPWCSGALGRLESNGWSYSTDHCSFKIFEREEAWDCVANRWIFVWGDSNFQDTVRNLALFLLEWNLPPKQNLADFQLERQYETYFINPLRPDQALHVSMVFNGHHVPWGNGEGLHTLVDYEEHQKLLINHFNGDHSPDTIVMNSGLHDGHEALEIYLSLADFTVSWWVGLYKQIPENRKPLFIWRTTVAPAGKSRGMSGNPNKLEMYNHIMVEKFRAVRHEMPVKFIDTFDLTFPFHYDNEYSDGGHYGRAPGVNLTPWFRRPHWYFVDVMLAHILLNAMCPS